MTWRVKFIDFPEQWRRQADSLRPVIEETVANGDLMLRHQLRDFEASLAEFNTSKHAVGVSNCTDGLRLLAHRLDIGPGDEVVTVAHTFVATISPFVLRGATPIFVDVGADALMNTDLLAAAVTEKTKAIVPVHLNGRTVNMDGVLKAAKSVDAVVIEDAAQALGATYRGRVAGTMGWASTYSFYPAKMLGALGDGGAVLTDDLTLAKDIHRLRDHGRVTKSQLNGWGYNCRLDNVQAAVLNWRLTQLPKWISHRRKLAGAYQELLNAVGDLELPVGPDDDPDRRDVYQNYAIATRYRDALVDYLRRDGIEVLVSWATPLHQQPGLGLGHWQLPFTERLSQRVLSLPLNAELSISDVEMVAESVKNFFQVVARS